MEQSTDNDIRISPLTIIQNRYGGGFLAFNLESWNVPKEINEDGLDFFSFWHHDARKYIIGEGDTPQEALDNLKAKLNPAPDNPLIDKFLFYDFKGWLGDESLKNFQFIVEQTHCKIIITSDWRSLGLKRVKEYWKAFMQMEFYSMTPIVRSFSYGVPTNTPLHVKQFKALEIDVWLETQTKQDYRYAILDHKGNDFFTYQQEHLVLFDQGKGLSMAKANEIVCLLNNKK